MLLSASKSHGKFRTAQCRWRPPLKLSENYVQSCRDTRSQPYNCANEFDTSHELLGITENEHWVPRFGERRGLPPNCCQMWSSCVGHHDKEIFSAIVIWHRKLNLEWEIPYWQSIGCYLCIVPGSLNPLMLKNSSRNCRLDLWYFLQ